MPEKTLILLTHHFPVKPGEEFLLDELKVTSKYFNKIIIYPVNNRSGMKVIHELPQNIEIFTPVNSIGKGLHLPLLREIFIILLNEFFRIPSKKTFFNTFRFNLALLKQCYLKALQIKNLVKSPENTIIYSYWCDDLALIGAFSRLNLPGVNFVSRAHGFDVFEEQSELKYIFFRDFQLSVMDKLWAVSRKGSEHLKRKNSRYAHKIDSMYLGILSDEKIAFEATDSIRLATCSNIRSIKRLELLFESLKLIPSQQIEWHVIGDGEDLEKLKVLSGQLSGNSKVVFHGKLNIDKIHELYSEVHFDFLVSLSISEGLPVSMMEAVSHGIPLLSTDVGGCSEIVNEVTGILIPVDFSPELLATKIRDCKIGKFNNLNARKSIVAFWKENFYSNVNYEKFSKELLALKQG